MRFPIFKPDKSGIRDAHRKAECSCERWSFRKRTLKNGTRAIFKQCLDCGKAIGSAEPKKNFTEKQFRNLEAWDDEKKLAYKSKRSEQLRLAELAEEGRKRGKLKTWYEEYLKTPEWKYRRERVLRRDNGTCQGCLEKPASDVHHLTYDHVGHEFLFELVSLCKECHERLHAETESQNLGESKN